MVAALILCLSVLFALSSAEGGNELGSSLSIYGSILAVGAPGYADNTGAVFIYYCPSEVNCTQTRLLTASDGRTNDTFGESLSLYKDLLVVGAPGKAAIAGAIYLFNCSTALSCTFIIQFQLTKSMVNQYFGYAVFVTGFLVVASAPGKNNYTGEVFLLNCQSSSNCSIASILVPPDLQERDTFGFSVGMSGSLLVVGASTQNSNNGAAYAFDCSNPSSCLQIAKFFRPTVVNSLLPPPYFGSQIWVDSNKIIYIGAQGWQNNAGTVFVYNCSTSQNCGNLVTSIQADDAQIGARFGSSVAADNGLVIIGSQGRVNSEGGIYVFNCKNPANNCTQLNTLPSPDGEPGDEFGYSVTISDNVIVVGAPFRNQSEGKIYTYQTTDFNPRN